VKSENKWGVQVKQSSTNALEQTNFNCHNLEFSFGELRVSNRFVEKIVFYDFCFNVRSSANGRSAPIRSASAIGNSIDRIDTARRAADYDQALNSSHNV
jgi:hypothetical protein